jgi:peptide/nickel transport system substrate-binding protein
LLPVYQSVMAEGVKDGLAGFAANINCSSNCWNMRDWYWAG